MKAVTLDGCSIASKEDLHRQLAQELGFPNWYGGNLDALHDCLTSLGEEAVITLCHTDALTDALGPYAQRVIRVLRDAAEATPQLQLNLA